MSTPFEHDSLPRQFTANPRLLGRYDRAAYPPIEMTASQVAALERLREAIDQGKIKLEEVRQCACGANDFVEVSARERWGLPMGAHVCLACGLVLTSPRIAAESLRLYYNEYYDGVQLAQPPDATTVMFRVGQGTKIFEIVRQYEAREKLTVLEIGCAAGSVLKEFCRAAASHRVECAAVGYDYGSKMVAAFNAEGLDIRVEWGGIEEAIRSQLQPDLVILSHVFEHFNDPARLVADLRTLCGPQTLLYIEVPGVLDLWNRPDCRFDWLRYATCSHPYHYNLLSLAKVMNAGGFSLLWGNEVVETVFRLGDQATDVAGNAPRVLAYLEMLEYTAPYLRSVHEELTQLRSDVDQLARKLKLVEAQSAFARNALWRRLRGMFTAPRGQ